MYRHVRYARLHHANINVIDHTLVLPRTVFGIHQDTVSTQRIASYGCILPKEGNLGLQPKGYLLDDELWIPKLSKAILSKAMFFISKAMFFRSADHF